MIQMFMWSDPLTADSFTGIREAPINMHSAPATAQGNTPRNIVHNSGSVGGRLIFNEHTPMRLRRGSKYFFKAQFLGKKTVFNMS